MKADEWWKNFALGQELDIAGAFIYNAIKYLHDIDTLSHSIDIFEILYGLSVGIERLQKVTIILLEHKVDDDIDQFEKSLITHNTMELSNRIDGHVKQHISGVHKEFLSILSKFYKSNRYGRYILSSIPSIDLEKEKFIKFLVKHLRIEIPKMEGLIAIQNNDQIRKFIGKVVKKITDGLYKIIRVRARELNIYTYELRFDSKASKVFLGERLDFIEENIIRREILVYLMNPDSKSEHIDLIREYDPLDLDPGLTPAYIKALIIDSPEHFNFISDEFEVHYEGLNDVKERLDFLSIIDMEWLSYEPDCQIETDEKNN